MFHPLTDDPTAPVLKHPEEYDIEEIDGETADRIRKNYRSYRLPVKRVNLTEERNDDWLKFRPEHDSDLNLVY